MKRHYGEAFTHTNKWRIISGTRGRWWVFAPECHTFTSHATHADALAFVRSQTSGAR